MATFALVLQIGGTGRFADHPVRRARYRHIESGPVGRSQSQTTPNSIQVRQPESSPSIPRVSTARSGDTIEMA